jgi:L-ascorbate metabolism protein UlaG (beta-lactamase superfamily)
LFAYSCVVKRFKRFMMILFAILATLSGGGYLFMQQKVFGVDPKGARLERILKSPNYQNGAFQNLSFTPVMAEGAHMGKILRAYMKKVTGKEPLENLPSVNTDLKVIKDTVPVLIWFGHSSYLIKASGKNILVDPVLSGNASPVNFFGSNYKGSNIYSVDDMPELDAVLITHDHYDHLDYKTIVKLIPKTKHFYTSLGVGAHLEYWGVPPEKITEFDWWEKAEMDSGFTFIAAPARHFSGRKFARGKTLWASYILQTPTHRFYLGGDSGYDTHFTEIGKKYGPFDIAILECGQYNAFWHNIHMMPEETAQAARDLHAEVLMPVHNSKFTLALHPWKEPIERVTKEAEAKGIKTTTPMIGEPVLLDKHYPSSKWWVNAK